MVALPIETWPQTVEEFDGLIDTTQDELIHFAFYRLGNQDDAEDAVQDVYVQAFRDRHKRRHITAVRAYLFRMVSNRCIDVLRARAQQKGNPVAGEPQTEEDASSPLDARERAESLRRLLQAIPQREAEVISLRAFSELSFAEIADALKSSVPTVKSRFRYGIDKLRRLLLQERVREHEMPRR
jgi:RNA polymerase sigma-70 factor (ECF subfamily)